MEKDPIELAPGKLGCPDCKHPLVPGLTPFYYRGHNLGAFDGIVCEMCGFGLLTEKGYEDTGRAIEAWDRTLPLYETEIDVAIKYVTNAAKESTVALDGHGEAEKISTTDRSEILLPPVSSPKRIRASFWTASSERCPMETACAPMPN